MVHHWPKEFLIWHCTVLSLGQMAQLIMIILSLTALTLCQLAQDVFPMAYTLTIIEPMLQNVSKPLLDIHVHMHIVIWFWVIHILFLGLCDTKASNRCCYILQVLSKRPKAPLSFFIKYWSALGFQ